MYAKTILAAALALTTGLVSALPANTVYYATFYDDTACTQNGGEAVSTANPGCLNESGRNSIYFQDAVNFDAYSLVVSPSPDCPCQNDCINEIVGGTAPATPYCYNLSNDASAQSFRFIQGDCAANNC